MHIEGLSNSSILLALELKDNPDKFTRILVWVVLRSPEVCKRFYPMVADAEDCFSPFNGKEAC